MVCWLTKSNYIFYLCEYLVHTPGPPATTTALRPHTNLQHNRTPPIQSTAGGGLCLWMSSITTWRWQVSRNSWISSSVVLHYSSTDGAKCCLIRLFIFVLQQEAGRALLHRNSSTTIEFKWRYQYSPDALCDAEGCDVKYIAAGKIANDNMLIGLFKLKFKICFVGCDVHLLKNLNAATGLVVSASSTVVKVIYDNSGMAYLTSGGHPTICTAFRWTARWL